MIRVKNRNVSAMNGWQFYEAALGKTYTNWDFTAICQEIRNGRLGNPRFKLNTDLTAIENEVDERNAIRMHKTGGAHYVVTDGDLSPKMSPLSPFQKLRAVAVGADTLVEWIASGAEAVPSEQSAKRAEVCVSCPLNGTGDWTSKFTEPANKAIRIALNQRNEWKLSTPLDSQLGVCDACLCPLLLKVHMPIDRITKRMPQEAFDRLDEKCWIRKNL